MAERRPARFVLRAFTTTNVRWHRRQAAMVLWSCVLLVCTACARPSAQDPGAPPTTASATDPVADAPMPPQDSSPTTPVLSGDSPLRDRPAGEPGRPAPTTAEIYAPFSPSAQHSVVVADAAAWTPHRIHSYRGRDDLPSLQALSPVLTGARPLSVLPEAVRVQTEPNALVAAWADQLGSFATGQRGIVVRADPTGVAVIDVKTGVDGGSYPIFVTSPSRSGLLVFSIGVH